MRGCGCLVEAESELSAWKSNADEAGALSATMPLLLLKGIWTLALIRLLNDWTMFIYIIEYNLFYFV